MIYRQAWIRRVTDALASASRGGVMPFLLALMLVLPGLTAPSHWHLATGTTLDAAAPSSSDVTPADPTPRSDPLPDNCLSCRVQAMAGPAILDGAPLLAHPAVSAQPVSLERSDPHPVSAFAGHRLARGPPLVTTFQI